MRRFDPIKMNGTGAFLIEGDQYVGCTLVNIPDDDPRKAQYISYFIRLIDLESAQKYLQLVNEQNSVIANEAFFIASLTTLVKCFSSSEKYTPLSEAKFRKFNRLASIEYSRFKKVRNSHFAHQSGIMEEGFAYLTVTPNGSKNTLLETPTVITDTYRLDYIKEAHTLSWVINQAHHFVTNAFDKLAESMMRDYEKKSREELLSYGIAKGVEAKNIQSFES